ncbi:MAG: prephenate dehydrogenase [Anaerolineaceae bacterium]|nr:prephenate dehydrogenase [Anaerolineaceae bacterium]
MKELILENTKIAIFGLGLMGGSLGLALKGKCAGLYGVDQNEEVINYVQKMSLFDNLSTKPEDVFPLADVIVLAVPVGAILETIPKLPEFCKGTPIILDLGSTKRDIMQAFAKLPKGFEIVGGHPMCGLENLGIENAFEGIYDQAKFALTALNRTRGDTKIFIEELICAIKAIPFWIGADQHDSWVATTSHLPYLMSLALALSCPEESAELIGPGYLSAIRLVGTPVSMMSDVLQTNSDEIIRACNKFIQQFEAILQLMESQEKDRLEEWMGIGRNRKVALHKKG